MQTREKPPVIVESDVKRLIKGDMIEIRDTILGLIPTVARRHSIKVDCVRIRLHYIIEDDWENVIFEIHVVSDEDSAFRYWEAISDAVSKAEKSMDQAMQDTLNDHVGVFVEW